MELINAVWEKRNLGVDCIEVSCAEHDEADELNKVLADISVSYSVVKIPAGSADLLYTAQMQGYMVAETGIEIWGDMRRVKTPKMYERFLPHIKMEQAEGEMLDKVLNYIRSGQIFTTDRVATDPHFSVEIAGRRYYYWCQDALEQGAYMGVLYYKDQPIAFNLSKQKEHGISDGLLGGVFPEAVNKGLGFLIVHGENEICKLHGGKTCIGRVSSNNLPILRLHTQYGYEIRRISYVLVKHQ